MNGILCLIRFLPLLDALQSPLRHSIDNFVRDYMNSGEIADGVLIELDDFREAIGPMLEYDNSLFFESSVASIALSVAETYSGNSRSAHGKTLEWAVGLWSALDRLLADRPELVTSLKAISFAERERNAQREDGFAIASKGENGVILRRIEQLSLTRISGAAELSRISTLLGWRPSGPCGSQCAWPSCKPHAVNCVRRPPFQPQQTLAARLRRKHGAEPKPWYLITLDYSPRDELPFEFVAEIGPAGYELRKVAQYIDGRLVCVDQNNRVRCGVILSPDPVPSWEELSNNPDMQAEETSEEFFEKRWEEGLEGFIRTSEMP
ncbi:hypothetical protein SRB5_45730 [Streptomyces sp. RB5]|uniref:DUF6881 domain-containing protein n=1 Tax=Streptomyces smaragdinus TaxID=2585196 RepID=A0A7K0CLP5_9ACTN|nr:hypothetical protein [Streptomyces smaragdinus]MQY14406.1 hypothetical protein [Streptomyces smaragdinus]